ncbi:MAG: methyltransferase domain-containing protein [Myxococcota bacterium]
MTDSTYYRDHWIEVEPERFAAYEEIFRWRPQMEPLLAPAHLAAGQVVADYGCGPGHLAVELARRVGSEGHVHAIDLNAEFVRRTRERADAEGVGERVTVHAIEKDGVPLPPATLDRIVCKNVLEYVDDPGQTLASFHAALRPGGIAHVIDSDWALFAVEPLGAERCRELFEAARHAYRTPEIGRRLPRLFRRAGFRDVDVKVLANPDLKGHMAPVVWNMLSYARASGRFESAVLDGIEAELKQAVADGEFLLLLPQFLVTGVASEGGRG